MFTVKTWCLPADLRENQLNSLHELIVDTVVAVESIDVKDESDMLNLFPSDLMKYGLGSEIVVEVDRAPGWYEEIDCRVLAEAIGNAVKRFFPEANIFCDVSSMRSVRGFWKS